MEVILIALFAFVLGLGFCFWGYRVFLVLLPIWGFFAGLWLGAETITLLLGDAFLATVTSWVVGIISGLVFALLSYLFYVFGVALVGAAIGAGLVSGLLAVFGLESGILVFILMAIGAVVAGGLTLMLNLQKYLVIILTAVGGANMLVLAPLLLFGRVALSDLLSAGNAIRPIFADSWFWALAWLILAILGVVFQLRINRTYIFNKKNYMEGWW